VIVLRVLLFLVGAAIVVFTLRSVIRTFLVPRALQAYLARAVFVAIRRVFRLRARSDSPYEHRDRVMAFYAPVSLLALLATWLACVLTGYTLMFFSLGGRSWLDAFTLAGSSLFTLGFALRGGAAEIALDFSSAAIGLGLLALFIAYLPSLYAGFQRRERGVSKLEVRAGQPPTGLYLIELAWNVGRLENLRDLWAEWEDWFVDVDETHSSFPALAFFRSTHPDQSWITAAGAILDGASLFASTVDVPRQPEPEFMIRAGYLCLRHLADFFNIPVDHDPKPDDPISIARAEYDVAYGRLVAAGIPVKADADQAWRDFAGWRVNYDRALIGLARLTMAPPAPWSSDRYEDGNFIPRAFPWLDRLRRVATRGAG
jgi:small basic protein